jgi:hypothetical protein
MMNGSTICRALAVAAALSTVRRLSLRLKESLTVIALSSLDCDVVGTMHRRTRVHHLALECRESTGRR